MESSSPYGDHDRRELLRFVPAAATTILDVGCHQGMFGHTIKQRWPDKVVVGIEPAVEPAAVAAGRLDEVIEGTWPDAVPADRRFDCVFFNDVLEHILDPWAALGAAHRHLNPGGRVVASIPNVRYLPVVLDLARHGNWTYRDEGVLDRTHLRFFTKRTIVELFDGEGFAVESIEPLWLLGGKRGRMLGWLGEHGEGLRAQQWAVVARPRSSGAV